MQRLTVARRAAQVIDKFTLDEKLPTPTVTNTKRVALYLVKGEEKVLNPHRCPCRGSVQAFWSYPAPAAASTGVAGPV